MESCEQISNSKKKRGYVCAVNSCKSKSRKNEDLSYHFFPPAGRNWIKIYNYFGNPEKIDVLVAWKKATKTRDIESRLRVCSRHFTKEDFLHIIKLTNGNIAKLPTRACTYLFFCFTRTFKLHDCTLARNLAMNFMRLVCCCAWIPYTRGKQFNIVCIIIIFYFSTGR